MSFLTDQYYESQYIQQMSGAIERTFKPPLALDVEKVLAELEKKESNP